MNEAVKHVLSYLPSVWRRRWHIVGVAWLICLIGWLAVAMVPDRYQSSARVYVDTDSLLRPLLRGLSADSDPARRLDLMYRTLISRPNLEKVVRMAELDVGVTSRAEMQRLLSDLEGGIDISTEQNNLFRLSYVSEDPQRSARVVQALIDLFVEGNLGAARQQLDTAQRFLDDQLAIYQRRLDQAVQQLSEFKRDNIGLLPGGASYSERMASVRGEVVDLEARLQDTNATIAELERQLNEVPQYVEGPSEDSLQARYLQAKQQLADLRLSFTDKHPDVLRTEALIAELKSQIEARDGSVQAVEEQAAASSAGMPNPLYSDIRMELISARAEAASLQNRLDRMNEQLQGLQSQAAQVPQAEARLQALQRQVELARANYEEFAERREATRILENRETSAEKVQFRIIEPPNVPSSTTGVPRALLLTAVLVIGVGAGLGVAILEALTQSTFTGLSHVARIAGVPVYGGISYVDPHETRARRVVRIGTFVAMMLVLVVAWGFLMMIESRVGLPNAVPPEVKHMLLDALPVPVRRNLPF